MHSGKCLARLKDERGACGAAKPLLEGVAVLEVSNGPPFWMEDGIAS